MPAVSFLITIHNKAPYLPFMLEGLRRQEGDFDREYIFIDDGSTDGSLAILKRGTDGWENLTIIEQRNHGPAHATNRAIALAHGDYIKPVDGDDVLLPWATEVLIDAIDQTGCGLAYSFFRRAIPYDHAGALSPRDLMASLKRLPGRVTVDEYGLFKSLHDSRTTPTSWIARTDVVRAAGGCDPSIFVQDYSLELRLALRTHFAELEEPVFFVPARLDGRIMENVSQLLHDCNMALAGLLRDEPTLADEIKHFAMRRAVNRAWSWARRHGKKKLWSRDYCHFIGYRLGLLPPKATNIYRTCRIFRETGEIRFPPKTAAVRGAPLKAFVTIAADSEAASASRALTLSSGRARSRSTVED